MKNNQTEFFKPGEPRNLISIQLRNRNSWAFPYTYLAHIQFDASGRLCLLFTTRAVIIEGRNLDGLYDCLLAGEVLLIREGDPTQEKDVPEGNLFIAKISVVPVEEYENS